MHAIGENDYALLELSAMKPISFLPPLHLSVAERLVRQGFLKHEAQHWLPTRTGLQVLGRIVH